MFIKLNGVHIMTKPIMLQEILIRIAKDRGLKYPIYTELLSDDQFIKEIEDTLVKLRDLEFAAELTNTSIEVRRGRHLTAKQAYAISSARKEFMAIEALNTNLTAILELIAGACVQGEQAYKVKASDYENWSKLEDELLQLGYKLYIISGDAGIITITWSEP